MRDDVFKSISSGSSVEETPENRKIHEVSNELQRRCRIYETQLRESKEDVDSLEIERRVTELYAKENGIWLPMFDVFNLGVPGPSGNENDIYVSGNTVYKVNNLLNSGSILRLFNRIRWHNTLFYDTAYTLYAFTGFEGRSIMPVFKQRLIKDAEPATHIEIQTYMAALGFNKINDEGRFANDVFEVWDLVPRNVLKDAEGDIYIIDAEIKLK